MTDPIAACVIASAAAAAATSFVYRWLTDPPVERTIERVEALEALVEKLKKAAGAAKSKPPPSGPFRTMPVCDPNTTSTLPDPVPTVIVSAYAWDADLTCPMCSASNRYLHSRDGKVRSINKNTHTACNGCEVYAPPHLHVECWACKFKYATKPASEKEEEAAP